MKILIIIFLLISIKINAQNLIGYTKGEVLAFLAGKEIPNSDILIDEKDSTVSYYKEQILHTYHFDKNNVCGGLYFCGPYYLLGHNLFNAVIKDIEDSTIKISDNYYVIYGKNNQYINIKREDTEFCVYQIQEK